MGYDYDALFRKIMAAVGRDGPFTDRMHGLIAYCERDMYVAACRKFSDDAIDWAVDGTFVPEGGALESTVLDELYRLAYSGDKALGNDAEYPLALAYGAMVARAALESIKLEGPFAKVQGAAAGFDSGDFVFLGTFRNGKLNVKVKAG